MKYIKLLILYNSLRNIQGGNTGNTKTAENPPNTPEKNRKKNQPKPGQLNIPTNPEENFDICNYLHSHTPPVNRPAETPPPAEMKQGNLRGWGVTFFS